MGSRICCARSVPDAVRTDEDALANLCDFPFAAHYREVGGLRLAHRDEGQGAPVLFVHGEPTWSFLWRKVIPPVRDAGFRCVAPDLPGFGASDKPVDIDWYSYDRHTEFAATLLENLDLRDATVVVHDWGGPIGLRLAVENPRRINRLVILDTGLFTGRQRMTDAWLAFRDFVARTEDLPIGMLVRRACRRDPGDDVAAAYDAPYPNAASKAGARAFPQLIPQSPDAPGAAAGQRVQEALRDDRRPTLMLWGDSDPVLPLSAGERFAESIGRPAPQAIEHASHFLQEDQGPLIGSLIAQWLLAA
jgi:haloalkane dehalogenase